MPHALRWCGVLVIASSLWACSPPPANPIAQCEAICIGCCTADGKCHPGNEQTSCGHAGAACATCDSWERCGDNGSCVLAPGGGSGGGTGGGAGGAIGGGTGGATGGGTGGTGGATGGGTGGAIGGGTGGATGGGTGGAIGGGTGGATGGGTGGATGGGTGGAGGGGTGGATGGGTGGSSGDGGLTCNASTCAGCCEGGTCRTGDLPWACGSGGHACAACGLGTDCLSGVCTQADGGLTGDPCSNSSDCQKPFGSAACYASGGFWGGYCSSPCIGGGCPGNGVCGGFQCWHSCFPANGGRAQCRPGYVCAFGVLADGGQGTNQLCIPDCRAPGYQCAGGKACYPTGYCL